LYIHQKWFLARCLVVKERPLKCFKHGKAHLSGSGFVNYSIAHRPPPRHISHFFATSLTLRLLAPHKLIESYRLGSVSREAVARIDFYLLG
jgi:hypothetical protein